ncbi:MAG: WYL domain-containing protein [Firmicutes bacterium]|nr:WYL domain-containing protein [Bacillota bacterium]
MSSKRERRLVQLIEMISSSGGKCRVRDVLERFGVCSRTLARDLGTLRAVGTDVRIDGDLLRLAGAVRFASRSTPAAMRRLTILTCLCDRPATLTRIVAYLNGPGREFSADERTVRRDLDYLESLGFVQAPPEAGPGYSLGTAFMPKFSLTPEELIAAVRAIEVAPESVADRRAAESIREKLLAAVAPGASEGIVKAVRRARRAASRRYIKGRAGKSDPAVLTQVQTLEYASLEQRVVRMVYRKQGAQEESRREVEPLGLVYYWFHDAWYLIAFCRRSHEIRHFRVDRIRALVMTDEAFTYPDGFDLASYMAPIWGVYADEPTRVRVRFYDEMNVIARLRAEVAARPSATLARASDGTYVLADYVSGLSEFRAWLRTFGSSAEVLEPTSLRDQLIESAVRMHRMYSALGPTRTASMPAAEGGQLPHG